MTKSSIKTVATKVSVSSFIAVVENETRRADAKTLVKLLKKLGKHKGGLEQCLYINKLADVDLDVLRKILQQGLAQMKKTWPVTAS